MQLQHLPLPFVSPVFPPFSPPFSSLSSTSPSVLFSVFFSVLLELQTWSTDFEILPLRCGGSAKSGKTFYLCSPFCQPFRPSLRFLMSFLVSAATFWASVPFLVPDSDSASLLEGRAMKALTSSLRFASLSALFAAFLISFLVSAAIFWSSAHCAGVSAARKSRYFLHSSSCSSYLLRSLRIAVMTPFSRLMSKTCGVDSWCEWATAFSKRRCGTFCAPLVAPRTCSGRSGSR
jgi:hypothetical protein